MASTNPNLSLIEEAGLVVCLALAPLRLILSIVINSLPAYRRGVSCKLWLWSRVLRLALGQLHPRQIQFIAPSTLRTYELWLEEKQKHNPHETLRLQFEVENLSTDPEGAIMWLGDRRKAQKYVLFFHGGGFMAPLSKGHLNWCWNSYIEGSKGPEVAAAILQYSLAPAAKFPTQLLQAAVSLNHLLQARVEPQNLLIGGDSAGGNLAIQLLYHITFPVPGIPPVALNGRRFAGVFLVSPWVSNRTDSVSFNENDDIDVLSKRIVKDTKDHVFHPGEPRFCHGLTHPAFPFDGSLSRLRGFQQATAAVYTTSGGQEVFRDHISAFAETLRRTNPEMNVTSEVVPEEVHDSILLEGDYDLQGDATLRMRRWAESRLRG